MDDLDFRRQAVIDPSSNKEKLSKDFSDENRRFLLEQLNFEQQLYQAMQIPVPENLADKIILSQQGKEKSKASKKFGYAFAAAIAAVMVALIALFNINLNVNTDNEQLKTAVLTHLYEDSHALDTFQEYSKVDVNTMLASMGGKLSDPIGNVSYLGRCIIGKNMGLHLVVRTESELITVLLLPYEKISKPLVLFDQNYSGIIVPSSKGGIVILGDKPDQEVNRSNSRKAKQIIQERIEKNLHWII